MPFLQLKNISKRFGDVLADDNVCLDVERGEVHALLGENSFVGRCGQRLFRNVGTRAGGSKRGATPGSWLTWLKVLNPGWYDIHAMHASARAQDRIALPPR